MLERIKQQAREAATQLLELAQTSEKELMIVGCSTSEVGGHAIGSFSSMEIATAIFDGLYPVLKAKGVFLAAQCCEHLNRSIIVEKEAAQRYCLEQVNVLPQPKAGGSFATTAYQRFVCPVAVEEVRATCGIDIGGTLIGMHLAKVAVPVRLSITQIGEAKILCARTRPKFVGGSRAQYREDLF